MVFKSTRKAIARWLAKDNQVYELLLSKCDFSTRGDELFVDCPRGLLNIILDCAIYLCQSSKEMNLSCIVLVCDGKEESRIPIDLAIQYMNDYKQLPLIWQIPDHSVQSIAIVRMADHKGLFCTSAVAQHCGANSNDWIGEDMSYWWKDDYLRQFTSDLEQYQQVSNYSYQAFRMSDREPIECIVNAWLTTWRGDYVRVVQTLQTIAI